MQRTSMLFSTSLLPLLIHRNLLSAHLPPSPSAAVRRFIAQEPSKQMLFRTYMLPCGFSQKHHVRAPAFLWVFGTPRAAFSTRKSPCESQFDLQVSTNAYANSCAAGFAIYRVHEAISNDEAGLSLLVSQIEEDDRSILSLSVRLPSLVEFEHSFSLTAMSSIRLEFFKFFHSTEEALKAISFISAGEMINVPSFTSLLESQLIPSLSQGEALLVVDDATAAGIRTKYPIVCVTTDTHPDALEIFRAIRCHQAELLGTEGSTRSADVAQVANMAQVLVLMKMSENGTGTMNLLSSFHIVWSSDLP